VKFLVEGFFVTGFDFLGKGQYELFAIFDKSSDILYPEETLLSYAVKGSAKLRLQPSKGGW